MNILIPVDFSENAFHAARFTMETFGPDHNYEILHCIHVSQAGATVLLSLNEEMKKLADTEMENFLAGLNKIFPDYDIDPILEFGGVIELIRKYAEDDNIDLIAMGTHGASGFKERFLGSNANSAARNVDQPTLIIPYNAVLGKPASVLLATDFRNDKNAKAINSLGALCKLLDCKLSILHVSTSKEDKTELAAPIIELEILSDLDYSLHYEFSDDIEASILEFANANEIDLIATVPHHEKFFERLFHTSVSQNLAYHSDVPLLIL